jgi:hypothetical protein
MKTPSGDVFLWFLESICAELNIIEYRCQWISQIRLEYLRELQDKRLSVSNLRASETRSSGVEVWQIP